MLSQGIVLGVSPATPTAVGWLTRARAPHPGEGSPCFVTVTDINGVEIRAKYVGSIEVPEPRGDVMYGNLDIIFDLFLWIPQLFYAMPRVPCEIPYYSTECLCV